jgi:hypothetical protein
MHLNQDFRDLLFALNDAGADYIVVGAHALAAHGHVRATKDLDIWVRSDAENAHSASIEPSMHSARLSRISPSTTSPRRASYFKSEWLLFELTSLPQSMA